MMPTALRDRGPAASTQGAAEGLSRARWVGLCAAAEGIGMTAAATAAKVAQAIGGETPSGGRAAGALGVVVAGGVVEGLTLGLLQAAGLRRLIPRLDGRRWAVATTLVAGVGWAAAAAPGTLSAQGDGSAPPLLLLLAGAAALGSAMGILLGAAQARGLRGHVRHPRRWIAANALGWAPAMAVIFLGAGAPDADWPVLPVAALGTVTGLSAGAILGLVTGVLLRRLDEGGAS
jgi:hypothetical protein